MSEVVERTDMTNWQVWRRYASTFFLIQKKKRRGKRKSTPVVKPSCCFALTISDRANQVHLHSFLFVLMYFYTSLDFMRVICELCEYILLFILRFSIPTANHNKIKYSRF